MKLAGEPLQVQKYQGPYKILIVHIEPYAIDYQYYIYSLVFLDLPRFTCQLQSAIGLRMDLGMAQGMGWSIHAHPLVPSLSLF